MNFYAHTATDPETGELLPKEKWEPLFTPWHDRLGHDPTKACSGANGAECPHCKNLNPSSTPRKKHWCNPSRKPF